MTDLVTFGETMLRLSPPQGQRLEAVSAFDVAVGGAESNVAVLASRFGHEVRWLSRVPDSPLGRRVTGELRRHGVDPAVDWAESSRLGTYYLEHGAEPRGTEVVYDREHSAFADVTVSELPIDELETAELFYTSGITPGLSAAAATATEQLLREASAADVRTAFDLNYRRKLWDPATARQTFESLLADVDLLFAPERDAAAVLGLSGPPTEQATALASEYDIETVVVTQGADGALCHHGDEVFEQSVYETETIDPIGTGDAFVGGFLARHLHGADPADALAHAAASAALKRTISGDQAILTPQEVQAVVDDGGTEISR
ncbi:2-keto-3-deoxygluconate kinase protein [Halorhabdus tiamatea SARL4B]|nr:bifunctional 2-dehydro-3-deoxygluconokinase/2-dehydro-3-deoxygalactonokinase [Halorhabdus tiamatea]ERJ04891.1 2-keto-3-deoxygluconate kinase protein [Halorhabdus tiamatea SARL4B]